MKTIEEIRTFINEELQDNEIFAMWNEYSDRYNYDDHIYYMEEFDEIMDGENATTIANKIFYGDFNPNNAYFCFNGYANLKSSDYLDDLISFYDLANYIYNNDEDFDNDELRDFLDEDENNEEEDETTFGITFE